MSRHILVFEFLSVDDEGNGAAAVAATTTAAAAIADSLIHRMTDVNRNPDRGHGFFTVLILYSGCYTVPDEGKVILLNGNVSRNVRERQSAPNSYAFSSPDEILSVSSSIYRFPRR